MELEPRQGDLFMTLISGGKKDEYPTYKSKMEKYKEAMAEKLPDRPPEKPK